MKNSPFAIIVEQATVDYIHPTGDRTAVRQISLELPTGSWTALIGENGSGKSTLAKALAGLSPLTAGRLIVHNERPPHIVLQNPETQLLGETVYEELSLSMGDTYVAAVAGAIDDVGADNSKPAGNFKHVCNFEPTGSSLPVGNSELAGNSEPGSESLQSRMLSLLARVGLSVPLDAQVATLSGGQKQLLNIACCLAAGAETIVFDEATSMLDPTARRTVLEVTAGLQRAGATVVWITHRMEELGYAERLIALDRGSIVFDGTVEMFFYGVEASDGNNPRYDDRLKNEPDFDRRLKVEPGLDGRIGCEPSPCERLGYEPPCTVQTARELQRLGHTLPKLPLRAEQLGRIVEALCQSR